MDGLTRLLMPMDCSDEEFAAAEAALQESDEQLEALRKVTLLAGGLEEDQETINRCREIQDDQIKVQYRQTSGGFGEAYISAASGEGVNILTDIPVVLRFFTEEDEEEFTNEWVQVDPWKWKWKADFGWTRFDG